jgi:chemotaxis signal transduction protein
MVQYKNITLDDRLAGVIGHMHAVEDYREVLQSLQAVWDNLTLLGQLSGTSTDTSTTRQAFQQLTASLLNQLGLETVRKCVQEVGAKAQVAIDILVRNLFERTADIGFLATDEDIREFLRTSAGPGASHANDAACAVRRHALQARLAEYVAKYSVYSDILLLDPSGQVVMRLDSAAPAGRTAEPWFAETLSTRAAYVEYFGSSALLPAEPNALIYAFRVADHEGAPLGVLCLCFRFENEMAGIFGKLIAPDDWSVATLLDADGVVVASSDHHHVPIGARLSPVHDAPYRIVRFGAQQYLAATRTSAGYQGYGGPGWSGHVMVPVQHAFNSDASKALAGLSREVLATLMNSPSLFGAALREIPAQAERIQSNLKLSVWNGNVAQSGASDANGSGFSKVLLWEISNTGAKTQGVFARSIDNLHQTVVSAILQDSQFQAALAIDIMDRNLYERANDCRWWALTSEFRTLLEAAPPSVDAGERIAAVLAYINGLYTVYTNLIVFDAVGQIVAVSNPSLRHCVGQRIDAEWQRRALAIDDSQGYVVSDFTPSAFYEGRPTFIYAAAIRSSDNGRVVGGVGIVFDSEPQFAAMLRDTLPRDEHGQVHDGAFGLFADVSGVILACSDSRHAPGSRLEWVAELLSVRDRAATVIALEGRYYAVGTRWSSGYREFKGEHDEYRCEVAAIVLMPLCEVQGRSAASEANVPTIRSDQRQNRETVEIATFRIGQEWYGVRCAQVVEAVNTTTLTPVPGAGVDLAGYLRHDGIPIPVFHVQHILQPEVPVAPANAERMVIVLRKNAATCFGLMVDALGEIPEVAAERLSPIPAVIGEGRTLADAILPIDGEGERRMLLILAMDQLYARMGPSASAPLMALARKTASVA